MKKDSEILITGAGGFVGRNLVQKLKSLGYTNIKYFNKSIVDFRDQHSVRMLFMKNRFEYVFHCAAIVGGIQANIDNPYKFLNENLLIQSNLINAAVKTKVKKVLFLGSSCIYPKDYKQPLKEEYLLQAPVEPTNEGYSLSKIVGLKLCEYANKTFDTNFISLMPCNLYGKYDNYDKTSSHVLASLIRKIYEAKKAKKKSIEIWGDGTPKREFMYVDDLVDCMVWSMLNLDKTKTFLNIGTGIDHTINELAEYTCQAFDIELGFSYDITKPNGMMKKCLDVSKINMLGWKTKIDIKEGIERTVDEYMREVK